MSNDNPDLKTIEMTEQKAVTAKDVLAKLADLVGMQGKHEVKIESEVAFRTLQAEILEKIKAQEDLNKAGMYGAVVSVFKEMDGPVGQARLQNIVTAIDGILLDRELTKKTDELIDRMYEITSADPKKVTIKDVNKSNLYDAIVKHVGGLEIKEGSKREFRDTYKSALTEAANIKTGEGVVNDDYSLIEKVLSGSATKDDIFIQTGVVDEFKQKLQSLKDHGKKLDAKEKEWQKQNPRKAAIMKMVPKRVVSALKKAKSRTRAVKRGMENVLNKNGLGRW